MPSKHAQDTALPALLLDHTGAETSPHSPAWPSEQHSRPGDGCLMGLLLCGWPLHCCLQGFQFLFWEVGEAGARPIHDVSGRIICKDSLCIAAEIP